MEKEYQDHEFCQAMKCTALSRGKKKICMKNGGDSDNQCKYTAKALHKWLVKEGYRIVKKEAGSI